MMSKTALLVVSLQVALLFVAVSAAPVKTVIEATPSVDDMPMDGDEGNVLPFLVRTDKPLQPELIAPEEEPHPSPEPLILPAQAREHPVVMTTREKMPQEDAGEFEEGKSFNLVVPAVERQAEDPLPFQPSEPFSQPTQDPEYAARTASADTESTAEMIRPAVNPVLNPKTLHPATDVTLARLD